MPIPVTESASRRSLPAWQRPGWLGTSRESRWWLLVVLGLLLCVLSTVTASGQSVRTGTTQVARASVAAEDVPFPKDAPRPPAVRRRLPRPPGDFNSYDAGWIRFAYPPSERQWVQPLIQHADEVREQLRESLGFPVLAELRVYVARTPGELAALAPEGATVPKYATGMAFSDLSLVLIALSPPYPNDHHDLLEVFRHELAHVALHQATQPAVLPQWLDEGFAVHASGESSLLRLRELSTATLANKLIPFDQLTRGFPSDPVRAQLAYAQAADIVRFLLRKQDQARFVALLERLRKGQAFEQALADAYGTSPDELELEWQKDVAKRYSFWPALLGGGFIWVGAVVLVVWGWRRRKLRDRATLERWGREESAEEAVRSLNPSGVPVRVHVVLARPQSAPVQTPTPVAEVDVPKVEHEGQWHTLH